MSLLAPLAHVLCQTETQKKALMMLATSHLLGFVRPAVEAAMHSPLDCVGEHTKRAT